MKKHFTLFTQIFALCVALAACTQPTQTTVVNPEATYIANIAAVDKFSIPRDTAIYAKGLWESNAASIKAALTGTNSQYAKYIVNGFRVHRDDLRGILGAAGDTIRTTTTADSVWVMLAVRPDTTYDRNRVMTITPQTAVIFQTTNKATKRIVYYDFTNPCPPNCPPIDTTKGGGSVKK